MRIKSMQVPAFGCFKDFETGELESNFVVVYGHNEAGKSTFFNLTETLLYGWRPVTDNPYLPWTGEASSLSAVIEDQSGEEIIVQRSLRTRPQGQLIKGQASFNLANNSLEFLAYLPRAIFAEVYFLTLAQLRFPHADVWQDLQDRLLGGQFVSFIKPVKGVLESLENEANSLWRADRRGKPEAKLLDEQILQLKQQRKVAAENEQILREKEEQLLSLREEQKQLKDKRIQLLGELNRAERLLPVKKKLERIKELGEKAGDIENYTHLPAEPEKSLKKLTDELALLAEEIKRTVQKEEELVSQKAAFGSAEQLYLAQAEEIGQVTKAYAQIAADQKALKIAQEEQSRNQEHVHNYAATFLLGGWQKELKGKIQEIDEVELRSELLAFKKGEVQYHNKLSLLEGIKARQGASNNLHFLLPLAGILSLLGLLGIFYLGNSPLGFAAALLLFLGLGLGIYRFLNSGKKSQKTEVVLAEKEVSKLKAECEESCARIKVALRGLPVAVQRLESPDETLLVDLKTMKTLIREKEALTAKLVQTEARLQEYQQRVRSLFTILEESSSPDIFQDLVFLEKGLTRAREQQISAQHAEKLIAEVETQLQELQSKQNQLAKEKQNLLESMQRLSGDNLQEKLDNLLRCREYRQNGLTLRQDLEDDYPDLSVIEKEIAAVEVDGATWFFSDVEFAAKKIEFTELEEKKEILKEKIARLETELQHLAAQERIADLEGALQDLQEERKKIAFKRDRLMLLHGLLREADHRFREEHQPDVLQKAGHYLERITEGRYDRLFVQEDGSGLMVRANYVDQLLSVNPPLSRGTLEQIYLALRLALVEHLDSGQERVPLFLDEILVNWDGVRLEKGLEILAEISRQRQIFLFTCHEWLVKKITETREGKTKVIKLS